MWQTKPLEGSVHSERQTGKFMRIRRLFIICRPKLALTGAWASPEVGLESSYSSQARGGRTLRPVAPSPDLPRVGVDVVLVNTAPW